MNFNMEWRSLHWVSGFWHQDVCKNTQNEPYHVTWCQPLPVVGQPPIIQGKANTKEQRQFTIIHTMTYGALDGPFVVVVVFLNGHGGQGKPQKAKCIHYMPFNGSWCSPQFLKVFMEGEACWMLKALRQIPEKTTKGHKIDHESWLLAWKKLF